MTTTAAAQKCLIGWRPRIGKNDGWYDTTPSHECKRKAGHPRSRCRCVCGSERADDAIVLYDPRAPR